LTSSERFCPTCKNKNLRDASVCSYCGTSLDENLTNKVAITQNTGGQPNAPVESAGSFVDTALIPEGGIGIYVAGAFKPFYLHIDKELVIGCNMEKTSGAFLDLSDLDAFNMGLSRRHVMIRKTESGFEVIDLSSTNGTWLNAERLVPNKPYPFTSGSQLRAGRMRLFIIYQPTFEGTRKK